jgi:hypothetical protein
VAEYFFYKPFDTGVGTHKCCSKNMSTSIWAYELDIPGTYELELQFFDGHSSSLRDASELR